MKKHSRPPLQTKLFEARTLAWWYSRREDIDMNPPYQRKGRLWSSTDKAFLIDSIINGFDVPKVYIADFMYGDSDLNEGRLPYAIIDGKQRFEAIFDFFDGKITLHNSFILLKDTSRNLGGLNYNDLKKNHGDVADAFDQYNFSVVSVISDSRDLINALFVRLNRSKPLAGAEIRNAMAGPAPAMIRELAKHEFFLDFIAFGDKRGQDRNAATKILSFEFHGDVQATKKKSLDVFTEKAAKEKDHLELAMRRVRTNLDRLTEIFLPRDQLLGASGLIPVYYWFVRNLAEGKETRVRDFLIDFENRRNKNRSQKKGSASQGSSEKDLLDYDLYNRSTNDVRSHQARVDILNRQFRKFI